MLADRPEVDARSFRVPGLAGLRDWLARETRLGNAALRPRPIATGDPT